jgi:hypothetical protein
MNKSDSIKNIAAALQLFHLKMGKVSKSANNPFFKSKYAPLPDILEAISDPLNEAGLVLSQFPDGDGLCTLIMHPESGEWLQATVKMELEKLNPQGYGSASTYYRRYSIAAALTLNIDEDDDGNKASAPEPTKAEDNRPWLNENTEAFANVKAFIETKTDKAEALRQVETKYKISEQTKEKLLS